MSVLTKRFAKVFKLALLVTVCCIIFVLTSRYVDEGMSKEYKSYLASYVDTYVGDTDSIPENSELSKAMSAKDEVRREKLQTFYKQVFDNVQEFGPKNKCLREYGANCKLDGNIGTRPDDYDNWGKLTSSELGKCLSLSYSERAMLKKMHYQFVESIGSLTLPAESYSGDGIVTVGGGKFSLLSFLIIKTLRNLGTTLPVEVFIPPNDTGDQEFCNTLLPKYNAKCIYITDVLPPDSVDNFEFKGYQFKSIAIIASSFENLLLLDADNFPIKDLDNIFDKEPYKSTGLVLWPDFWRRTTNPAYYEIADIPVNYKNRVRNCMDDITPPQAYTSDMEDTSDVPLHDLENTIPDVSTESGQIMISKSKHLPTVLLSLYYNVYGPSWYYPIFSQKAAGEGDKETFIAAANFYELDFYQVKSITAVDGYHRSEGFRGVAMLQHDFVQDYQRYQHASEEINAVYEGKSPQSIKLDPSYSPEKFYETYFESETLKEVDIMFVHSNLPKFDPVTLWKDQDLIVAGQHIRSYTNLKRLNGYDLELENFKVFKEYLCDTRTHFKYVDNALQENETNWESMCQYITERLLFLDKSHANAIKSS